jgi:hypothetical protein
MSIFNVQPIAVKTLDFDTRELIHRQTLINRISQFICIISDYEQAPLLKEFDGLTIPFYIVGVDDDMSHAFRMYFAEIYYEAVFNAHTMTDADHWPLFGQRIAAAVKRPEAIEQWLLQAYREDWILTLAERDYVSEFSNTIYVAFLRREGKLAMDSAGAYVNGVWHDSVVDGRLLKYFLGYDKNFERIVDDEFVLPYEFAISGD